VSSTLDYDDDDDDDEMMIVPLMMMMKSQSFEREKTLMCVFRCLQAAQVSKSSSEAFSHVYERQFWHSPTGIFNNKNNNKILINNSKNKNIYNNPIL
jgi:hypothetical protein